MTVSEPQRVAQIIFSTSSSTDDATAELPMLALIFTRKLRPMIIGSLSGWLILAGMIARPRATSSRTNSAVTNLGIDAPKLFPVVVRGLPLAPFSRAALAADVLANSDVLHLRSDDAFFRVVHLGNVTTGLGAQNRTPGSFRESFGVRTVLPIAVGIAASGISSTSPRALIHSKRSGLSPARISVSTLGSVYGPEVS